MTMPTCDYCGGEFEWLYDEETEKAIADAFYIAQTQIDEDGNLAFMPKQFSSVFCRKCVARIAMLQSQFSDIFHP